MRLLDRCNCSKCSNFEGKVIYKNTFTSALGTEVAAKIASSLGEKMEYYVKGGSYKTLVNAGYMQYQVYLKSEGKLYTKLATGQTFYWNDVTEASDTIVATKLEKNKEERQRRKSPF